MDFLKLGQKGQAFSTFKLLIAAIVAVVILVILLSILGYIDFSPRNQPAVGAADALKEAYQNQYLLQTSQQSVTFTKDTSLTSLAIKEKADIGLGETQICLSLGDFSDATSNFSNGGAPGQVIKYTAGGSMNARFSVLCAPGADIETQIGAGNPYSEIDEAWDDDCAWNDSSSSSDAKLKEQICCIIVVRYAR
ncbi:MAG: hypothetical protein NT067_06410 [Candidatus Diapherotrites archaeon]|nr:hypothetical protein [Candidatus Diapherotrites archaeon]